MENNFNFGKVKQFTAQLICKVGNSHFEGFSLSQTAVLPTNSSVLHSVRDPCLLAQAAYPSSDSNIVGMVEK